MRQINNTSGLSKFIDDIGVEIPAGLYLIPPERYWYFASSQDIDVFINSGQFVIIHNGISLNAFDGGCLIHEGTDYCVSEVDTPTVSVVTRQTKILRFQGPIFSVGNTVEGRTDVGLQLSGSAEGKETGYQFFNNGANIKDKWLDHEGSNIPCDNTPGIVASNCKIRLLTYSNDRNNSNIGFEIYRNGTSPSDLIYTWEIDSLRYAWKTNAPLETLTFSAGDLIRVYASNRGGTSPSKAVVKVTLVNTDNILSEGGGNL